MLQRGRDSRLVFQLKMMLGLFFFFKLETSTLVPKDVGGGLGCRQESGDPDKLDAMNVK